MGAQLAQQPPQPSAASASFKSPVHMLPVMLPPQATCTASVSLRRQDLRASKSRPWDWTDHEAGLVKHTSETDDANIDGAAAPAAHHRVSSAKPCTRRVPPAADHTSTVERLLDFLTIMWTGGASSFQSSTSSPADDLRLPYRQMDTFAAAFGPMPLGAAITSAPLAAAYSRC